MLTSSFYIGFAIARVGGLDCNAGLDYAFRIKKIDERVYFQFHRKVLLLVLVDPTGAE